jgi:hypothetical protein
MRVLEPDLEAGACPVNGLHLYCSTGQHAIIWVIACSLIRHMNLACSEGTRLDCCDVISTAIELGTTIITLGRLYFMFSCQFTPTDAAPVQHGRRVAVRQHAT